VTLKSGLEVDQGHWK